MLCFFCFIATKAIALGTRFLGLLHGKTNKEEVLVLFNADLHQLRVPDKIIQRILRPANVAVTQSCYIKTPDGEVARAKQQFERFLEYAPNMHLPGDEREPVM